jgi:pyruvate formate lyase activating enzyme
VSEIVSEIMEDKMFFDTSGGGATLSGGEVLFQPDFAESLLAQLHGGGIHTVVETSGMGKWEHLQRIAQYTDIFYYDIKTLNSAKHIKYTGAGNEIILDNLKKLSVVQPDKITLRVPLIPGHSDSEEEIAAVYKLSCELSIRSVHLLRYNVSAPAKYQWLDLPYQLGGLPKQSGDYIDKLRGLAPEEINVTVF